MERLSAEEMELVARAWEQCRHMARIYQRKCRGPDYDGWIGLRLAESIRRYDRSKDLKKWAVSQARYACLDAMREHGNAPNGTRSRPRARFTQELDHYDKDDLGSILARRDPTPAWEYLEAYEVIARHVVGKTRAVLDALYRDGLGHEEAAVAIGCKKKDIADVHGYAMRRLRQYVGPGEMVA